MRCVQAVVTCDYRGGGKESRRRDMSSSIECDVFRGKLTLSDGLVAWRSVLLNSSVCTRESRCEYIGRREAVGSRPS